MIITLNRKTYSTNKNPNININFSGKKVLDEVRGYLVYVNSNWVFIGISQIQQFKTFIIKKLALILESPHKDEFDQYNNPLRPANGKTGHKINNKICSRSSITSLLNTTFAYEVYLINPIQYQTSCYCVLGSSYSRANTNEVFRKMFSKKGFNLRKNFISRLKKYNPNIIINCCTSSGGLKKTVEVAIKEAVNINNSNYTFDYHPSVW